MTEHFPSQTYQAQIASLGIELGELRRRKNLVSWARLAAIVILLVAVYYLHEQHMAVVIVAGIFLLAIFIRMVLVAVDISAAISNKERMVAIAEQELSIAAGKYNDLPNGSSFLNPEHAYANDLDIFGNGSVYQYINRTQSEQGHVIFAAWLLEPSPLAIIQERQEAIKELAPQFKWRHQLQAFGVEEPITISTEKKVAGWLEQPDVFSTSRAWRLLQWLYPPVMIALVVLYAIGILPDKWFILAYIVGLAVSGLITRVIMPHYNELNKIVPQVDALYKSAKWIESNKFTSPYLRRVQLIFLNDGRASSTDIRRLKKILDKFDYNLNLVLAMVLNPLLLWNLQVMVQLENWRRKHRRSTPAWFGAVGEMEAVASLANLHFNHPQWAFPAFDERTHGTFEATGIGHPLIAADKMVYNDFSSRGDPQIALITGSNMAGKSTFLRSTAVNIVLAMMGAPACVQTMRLSPMRVMSSMRVADNLQESTSTFYAELKKLKTIITAVNNREKVFILLDEILRGTNSLDRHTGSKALVRQLIKKGAVAMLATHDVELAQLQEAYPLEIHNYHFDAQIANEELYFDYRLKEGICKSINASVLMKKIGIEL